MSLATNSLFAGAFALTLSAAAQGAPISYVTNLYSTAGNDITDILILEEDSAGVVHADPFAPDLSGRGTAVIYHEPAYDPVRSIVLGLTRRADPLSVPQTDTVAFMDSSFLASKVGIKWSAIFPTIGYLAIGDNLKIVSQGPSNPNYNAAIDFFRNDFYTGAASGASFASRSGNFAVGEFSAVNIIGASAVSGNWQITNVTPTGPGLGVDIDESATDLGPFSLALTQNFGTTFSVEKDVTNNSGLAWDGFTIDLLGTFDGLVPTMSDVLVPADSQVKFQATGIADSSGAFTVDLISDHQLHFTGLLLPGQTANFAFVINDSITAQHRVVLQQSATAAIPEPASLSLVGIAVLGLVRRRRVLNPD